MFFQFSYYGETFLPKADTPTRWIKSIPIKVNVFVWKALQDRLPTRSNLVRRNILIDSLSCPICDGEPEDSSHLFFRCCLARDVTRLVCRWWDLDFHSFNSYTDWQGWFNQLRLGAKSKEVLEGVFYVSWWSLWNFRNHLLFADSNPRKDAIFDEIVLRSFNWCLARGKRARRVERRYMSPPRVRHEGIKKTAIVNFKDLCQAKPEHVMTFLEAELGTTGSLDSYHKLELNGRFVPKNLEGILKRYTDKYVICYSCNSENTSLVKHDGAMFVKCKR
ncbi:RNA-directed DNA polymerase, eukaryota, partial [Tanacetum coccineum]